MLAALRERSTAHWLGALPANARIAQVEAQLQQAWQGAMVEIRIWLPEDWAPALRWCEHLADLSAVCAGDAVDPLESWAESLRLRLPPLNDDERNALIALITRLRRHRLAFANLPAGNGWPERAALERGLLSTLRRLPLNAVAVLAWVALLALEWERVRGEWVRRAAEPAGVAA